MRKFVILGALGAVLAGCANAYDRDAVPVAGASYRLAMDRCGSQTNTLAALSECQLEADKQLAVAIKLSPMALYDTYAARMRLFVQDIEARRVAPEDVGPRLKTIKADYLSSIIAAQDNADARQAQAAAAMAGMSEGFQRAADRQAYIQANQPKPFNCTSTQFGGTVQTNCR